MPQLTRAACSSRHRRWCSAHHLWLVTSYRDARDAVLATHELNHQLERHELARPPTFRDWLVGHAGVNREVTPA